jgi:hypothetical protein
MIAGSHLKKLARDTISLTSHCGGMQRSENGTTNAIEIGLKDATKPHKTSLLKCYKGDIYEPLKRSGKNATIGRFGSPKKRGVEVLQTSHFLHPKKATNDNE